MPSNLRSSGNDGRESDDWLGSSELDWGDEPTGARPPVATRPGGAQTNDPLWPSPPGSDNPDEATIRRRRAVGLAIALAVITGLLVVAVIALGGDDGDPTSTLTPTTTVQPPPPPPTTTPKTQTTPKTTTTPATGALTLPGGESLELGSTGDEVKELQEALTTLGFDPGTADGDFGATTAAAVGEFQRAHGLPDDGVVGPATLQAINDALAAESSPA